MARDADGTAGPRARVQLLIVSAPVMLRHPFFRTPLGRVVQVAGGAALLVRVAEAIRDWEPEQIGPT